MTKAQKMLRDVPTVCILLAAARLQGKLDITLSVDELGELMASIERMSVQQLKLLREVALGIADKGTVRVN